MTLQVISACAANHVRVMGDVNAQGLVATVVLEVDADVVGAVTGRLTRLGQPVGDPLTVVLPGGAPWTDSRAIPPGGRWSYANPPPDVGLELLYTPPLPAVPPYVPPYVPD